MYFLLSSRTLRWRCSLGARHSTGVWCIIAAFFLSGCGSDELTSAPSPPDGALQFVWIASGYAHTCALSATGYPYCWGGNDFGTLGDGTYVRRDRPTRVIATSRFDQLDAGAAHNCGIDVSGGGWCWGHNDEGQLGDNTFTDRDRAVPVAGGHAFRSISAGHAHSCGVTVEGEAWCWGDNSRGQLGSIDLSLTRSAAPVKVAASHSFARIMAGYYQTCALASDNTAWCWGQNASGQNGDGSTDGQHWPVRVSGGLTFSDIAPGDAFVCGVSGSAVWCWGANRHGELGTSGPSMASAPIPSDLTGAASVTTSMGSSTVPSFQAFACAALVSGAIHCWGGSITGLRDGNAVPSVVDPGTRADVISAGGDHVCIIARNGYAYCGGANFSGQLGDGTATHRSQFVPVAAPS